MRPILLPWGGRQLCARRWLQSVPSRSVLDAVRLLAWPAISRGLWQLAKKAGVEFTNGKRPVRLRRPRAKRTQHRRNESLRPRLIAGVQGRWARASHSRVIPHTATAWCHITFSRAGAANSGSHQRRPNVAGDLPRTRRCSRRRLRGEPNWPYIKKRTTLLASR